MFNHLHESSLYLAAALALFHTIFVPLPSALKRVLFMVSASTFVIFLSHTPMMGLLLTLAVIALGSIEQASTSQFVKKFVLISMVAIGDWVDPTIVESMILLGVVGIILHRDYESDYSIHVLGLWLLAMILGVSSEIQLFENVSLYFVCALSVAALSLFWVRYKNCDSITIMAQMLLVSAVRLIIESQQPFIQIQGVVAFTKFFVISFLFTAVCLIVSVIKDKNFNQGALRLLALGMILPFTPDEIPASRAVMEYSLVIVAASSALANPLARAKDYVGSLLFVACAGLALICYAITFVDISISRSTQFGLIVVMTSTLTFIGLGLKPEFYERRLVSGERLPQILYGLAIFGALATLWYILSYVRQIQG